MFIAIGCACLLLLAAGGAAWWFAEHGCLPFFHPLSRPRAGQIRVACVGDSITYGYGIRGWHRNSYPAELGRLLGSEYCVNNFGYSGRTASPEGDFPYIREKLYRQSLEFQPNIVLLMLGTNDAKLQNWQGAEAYTAHIRRLAQTYRTLKSKPEIWLLTPPPAWENTYSIDPTTVLKAQQALRKYAKDEGVFLFDTAAVFEDRRELFPDGVHPGNAGAAALAKAIYSTMKGRISA